MASESSRGQSFKYDMSDSLSGIFEADKTVADKFEGVLYNVLPSKLKVNIQFCIPVLFNDFMSLLEKEFVNNDWSVDDTFSVSSHIQGRKVKITAHEAEKTIEISGPGHKLWKDIAFKRIASTLFTRFMQSFNVDSQRSINTSNVHLTSTPMVTRPIPASVPVLSPVETSSNEQVPVETQLSAILESLAYHSRMISTLQEQLTSLTSEVVKLQEQRGSKRATMEENQSESESRISRTISVSSNDGNSLSTNSSQIKKQEIYETPSVPKSHPKPKRLKAKSVNKSKEKNTQSRSSPQTTKPPKYNKTLIIGDSIIKGINERGLKQHVHCHGISGATVETVLDQLSLFDLKNLTSIVISVGGNDLSKGSNVEYIEEKFDQLLLYIKKISPDCKVAICTVCPRQDCDVTELNGILRSLSEEYCLQVVDMEKHFCDSDGIPVLRYYSKDKIHLSKSGIRRLLDAMEKSCDSLVLVENFEQCVFGGRHSAKHNVQHNNRKHSVLSHHRREQIPSSRNFLANSKSQGCVKCGESNHSTFDCKHKDQIQCYSCGYFGHKQMRCPNK